MSSRTLRIGGFVALATVLLSGCGKHPLDTFDTDGEKAELIADLFYPVLGVAIFVFIVVQSAIVYMVVKYRAPAPGPDDEVRPGGYPDDEYPGQNHGNTRLEILWTIVPTVMLAAISVFTLVSLFDLDDVEASEESLAITVVGQQWWWEFQYHLDGDTESPPDFVTANEMVIPVEVDVPLLITSRDVIHSYWIPRLNGKRDGVPGREHPWVIQANEVGRFAGQCTEFCGLSHAYMRMWTEAVSAADFDVWVENQLRTQPVLVEGDVGYDGQQLFAGNCQSCHVITGVTQRDRDGDGTPEVDTWDLYQGTDKYVDPAILTAGAAPNLTHFMTRQTFAGSFFDLYDADGDLNRAQLEAWIRNAPAEKPNNWENQQGMTPFTGLTADQVDDLVEYLTTLR